jgi:hypothetical protein
MDISNTKCKDPKCPFEVIVKWAMLPKEDREHILELMNFLLNYKEPTTTYEKD